MPTGVKVRWVKSGNNNFISKAMQVVMSMDKMVGKDFEKGLANLKATAEAKGAGAGPAAATVQHDAAITARPS